ncbi:putative monooxygenase [Mycobacterium canettii CIPT 140010059]|uniref:Monooxygenase n=3 Tax=Mycobacterium tuberculosis complex TaxID=77643 RepID=A0AB72XI40_MYCCP|nr:putative monooxygenase [Mycobacterium canettii CIPT 140010059]
MILDKAPGPARDGHLRPGREVLRSVFDDNTDTWVLGTAGGETFRCRVVIATHRQVHVPWIPDFAGRADYRGESFHAAAWDRDFDPAGKRIAVVGTDAAAAHYISRLSESAASVTVFTQAPRRVVTGVPLWTTRAKRWLRRRTGAEHPAVALATAAIDALTSSGIRTSDGVEHPVDAIIYGTGFAIADQVGDQTLVGAGGVTIRQAWDDGMEPYLGVAVHGFPNYFFITGPDTAAQARCVVECMKLMERTASRRIEVRRSSQQVFNERAQLKPAQPHRQTGGLEAFDLSSAATEDDQTYDGAATLTLAGARFRVRVRLTGHLDPIDGNYHWQGTVFDSLPETSLTHARAATLTIGGRSAPARITEQTPWGTHSVAGVGPPPYARSGPASATT